MAVRTHSCAEWTNCQDNAPSASSGVSPELAVQHCCGASGTAAAGETGREVSSPERSSLRALVSLKYPAAATAAAFCQLCRHGWQHAGKLFSSLIWQISILDVLFSCTEEEKGADYLPLSIPNSHINRCLRMHTCTHAHTHYRRSTRGTGVSLVEGARRIEALKVKWG